MATTTLRSFQIDYIMDVRARLETTHLSKHEYDTELAWIQDCVTTFKRDMEVDWFETDTEARAFQTKLNELSDWLHAVGRTV